MGVIDEHWCSECKKYLDKTKERKIMKKYSLTCIHCMETDSIFIHSGNPEILKCGECDEEINLDDVRKDISEWQRYFDDLAIFLAGESKELTKESSS